MPSDANGVHSLPNGYRAEDGDTIQPSQHNPPLEDVSSGLTERLMRSGVAPMTGPLKFADGNSGAPGAAFNSDPSAGFYLENGKIKFTKPIVQKELIGLGPLPWSRLTAPPGWVLCFGQTLSRTAYADLWLVAQVEIAAGNPMYNNGDGSTTFGIMDMRGRVVAGYDRIGGTPGGVLGGNFGTSRGFQEIIISPSQLPAVALGVTVTGSVSGSLASNQTQILQGLQTYFAQGGGAPIGIPASQGQITVSGSMSGTMTGGTNQMGLSAPHDNVQPTLIANMILYAGA